MRFCYQQLLPEWILHISERLNGLVQLLLFVFVQLELDNAANSSSVHNGWRSDEHVLMAVFTLQVCGDRQSYLLVLENGARDAGQTHTDSVGSGALGIDNLVGGITSSDEDVLQLVVKRGVGGETLGQTDACDVGAGQHRQLGVAVFQ